MKNDQAFSYHAEVEWIGGRRGNLHFPDMPSLEVAAPPEFQGPGGGWTPEGLYIGSVVSCFMLTFIALAGHAKLSLVNLDISADGKLEAENQRYQVTEITLKPVVVVRYAEDVQKVERLLKKAEQSCFIAASIKSRIAVVPAIYHRQVPTYPCPAVSQSSAPVIV